MTAGVPLVAATSTLIVALTTYGVATTLKSLRRCVLRHGCQVVCDRLTGGRGGGVFCLISYIYVFVYLFITHSRWAFCFSLLLLALPPPPTLTCVTRHALAVPHCVFRIGCSIVREACRLSRAQWKSNNHVKVSPRFSLQYVPRIRSCQRPPPGEEGLLSTELNSCNVKLSINLSGRALEVVYVLRSFTFCFGPRFLFVSFAASVFVPRAPLTTEIPPSCTSKRARRAGVIQ